MSQLAAQEHKVGRSWHGNMAQGGRAAPPQHLHPTAPVCLKKSCFQFLLFAGVNVVLPVDVWNFCNWWMQRFKLTVFQINRNCIRLIVGTLVLSVTSGYWGTSGKLWAIKVTRSKRKMHPSKWSNYTGAHVDDWKTLSQVRGAAIVRLLLYFIHKQRFNFVQFNSSTMLFFSIIEMKWFIVFKWCNTAERIVIYY